ncbi:hypothetical protein OSB04_017569 [Centaurea solstitialis]|uniref:Reverse transcriptase zinc-binding domain-containing protein n=1 Tax=Centaurea solstitialis TaxID=347529 RepID=A0AA38T4R9_9ASTR|nr:hypothetical protein OSB04_017569 [Centaurea solstitialis]
MDSECYKNVALLTKWWWRFKKERETLWRRVIHSLHGINGGLDQIIPIGKFAGLWRNIIKVQRDFEKVNLPLSSWFQMDSEFDFDTSSVTWALDNEGVFSVSSARKAYDDFYLTAHQVNLIRRGISAISSQCALCNDGPEDEDHLFVSCRISRTVLQEIGGWWGVETTQIHSIEELFGWGLNKSFNKDQQKALNGDRLHLLLVDLAIQKRENLHESPSELWVDHVEAKCREFRHNWIGWCSSPASCF